MHAKFFPPSLPSIPPFSRTFRSTTVYTYPHALWPYFSIFTLCCWLSMQLLTLVWVGKRVRLPSTGHFARGIHDRRHTQYNTTMPRAYMRDRFNHDLFLRFLRFLAAISDGISTPPGLTLDPWPLTLDPCTLTPIDPSSPGPAIELCSHLLGSTPKTGHFKLPTFETGLNFHSWQCANYG